MAILAGMNGYGRNKKQDASAINFCTQDANTAMAFVGYN
jgi:hypothetical protein